MSKNPISWMSLPALLTILAYIGCQPRDLQKLQEEVTRKAWEQVHQATQNGSFNPNLGQIFNGSPTTQGTPYAAPGTYPPTQAPTNYAPGQFGYPTQANQVPNSGYPYYPPTSVSTGYQPVSTPTGGFTAGGQTSLTPVDLNRWQQPSQALSPVPQTPGNFANANQVPFDNRSLIIGTFNIQAFGRAKLSNSSVMEIIVNMIRRFDLIAIQELRSTEQVIIPTLVDMLNATGMKYGYYVGERQGYTNSKEQYVFIYDTTKLRLMQEPFITQTRTPMHRPPLAARFQVTQLPPQQAFSFTLLNVHTDPDEVVKPTAPNNELKTIGEAVAHAMSRIPDEDDFIVLGDFNAPTDFMSGYFPWFASPWYVVKDNWVTNVRENKNYDNIVFDARYTNEHDGRCGVFNFKREYQLSEENALQVSDHFPVWATFSIFENANQNVLAQQPAVPRR